MDVCSFSPIRGCRFEIMSGKETWGTEVAWSLNNCVIVKVRCATVPALSDHIPGHEGDTDTQILM